MKTNPNPLFFVNGKEVHTEAEFVAEINRHTYRPRPNFYRPHGSDRWQVHARASAPPVTTGEQDHVSAWMNELVPTCPPEATATA